jgi:uncharacterized YigZ family protein
MTHSNINPMSQKAEYNQDEFFVPDDHVLHEIKIKGSRFITQVVPVAGKEEAENQYERIRREYFNATHNCFAYRIDELIFRYSDDGEPSGTAGKPILQVIDGFGLSQALCVVTRYFGGTKLGTGGLIRAYSQAARETLQQVKISKRVHCKLFYLTFNYDLENMMRKLLHDNHVVIQESHYEEQIGMRIAVPECQTARFVNVIRVQFHHLISLEEE